MMIAAAALLSIAAGCRAPGTYFGTDPLQHRFGQATQSAIEFVERRERDPERYDHRQQQVLAEPVVIASYDNDRSAD